MNPDVKRLDDRLDAIRAQATSIKNRLYSDRKDIERDPRLSDQGRADEIAQMRRSAQVNLDALKRQEADAIQAHVTSLERAVFGFTSTSNPSEIISRRDAGDRADRISSSDEAAALLTRAERSGDQHLAQAIVRVAASKGYRSVIAAYDAGHPGTGQSLEALAEIENVTSSGEYSMGRGAAYSAGW